MAGSQVGRRARNYVDRYHGTGIGGRDPGGLDGHRWRNSASAGNGAPAWNGPALGSGNVAIPAIAADRGGSPLSLLERGPRKLASGSGMRYGLSRWGIFRQRYSHPNSIESSSRGVRSFFNGFSSNALAEEQWARSSGESEWMTAP